MHSAQAMHWGKNHGLTLRAQDEPHKTRTPSSALSQPPCLTLAASHIDISAASTEKQSLEERESFRSSSTYQGKTNDCLKPTVSTEFQPQEE